MKNEIRVEIEIIDKYHCSALCDFFEVTGGRVFFCKLDNSIFHSKDEVGYLRTVYCKKCGKVR